MGLSHLEVHFDATLSLVYGAGTVVPIVVMIISRRLALASELTDFHD